MKALVCGCGESVQGWLPEIPRWIVSYGVNDSTRYIETDVRVILDRPRAFKGDRMEEIQKASVPATWFLHQKLWEGHVLNSHQVKQFKVKHIKEGSNLADLDSSLYHTFWFCHTSPSTACWLAYLQGYEDIGMIGVDLVTHRILAPHMDDIEMGFGKLRDYLKASQVRLVNLSQNSALQALEKMDFEEWLDE